MKRTLSFMVMALALLLTQCRKPEVKFPSPVAPEGTTVSMTVTAGPGSKTDITAAGAITWSEGDKLYVGFDGEYVGCLTLTSGQNTPTGWFSGNVTLPEGTTGEKTFHFFYLGRDNGVAPSLKATTVDVSFATQEIYADANSKLANASKYHVGYGSAKGTVAGSEVTGINVTLVSKVALARFSFKKNSTDYTDALTLSGTNIYKEMTVNFAGTFTGKTKGTISLTGSHRERYVMLVPTGATTAQTLTFTGSAEDGTGDVPGLESNKFYGKTDAIAVTLTASAVHVTSVSLNETSLSLAAGATETLTATVYPVNATDKSVTWSSTDESVATVDNGTVTAVAAGTATIRVTTVDGGKTAECAVTVTAPAPTTHVFSVGSGTTVEFAPGNLYYNGANDSNKMNENLPSGWNFYGHQWDCYPSGTTSVTNKMEISLFTWGYGSWSTVYNTTTFPDGPVTMVDWGTAPGLPSAGEDKSWHTLSKAEWVYLLNTRSGTFAPEIGSSTDCRYAEVKVNGVKGLLIFPDVFAWPSGVSSLPSTFNTNSSNWNDVDYTTADFGKLEYAGVVFLPAAGRRNGESLEDVGYTGRYWTSSTASPVESSNLVFHSGGVSPGSMLDRCYGCSVRLVR